MAEAKWSGVLSTTEPRNDVGIIKVRQGNINSEVAEFQIVQNNKPYNLTGLTVYFCASFGLNLVEKPAVIVNAAGGRIQYTFDDDSMQSLGRQKGYFSIKKEESKIDSTQDFEYQVESSLMTRSIDGKSYIYKLSALIKILDDFVKNGQKNFNTWFESVKEILYGVDPGGNILRELIEARKNSGGNIFASLKERLDKNEDETNRQLAHNTIDVMTFGAVGDGINDDTEAIQNAIDYIGRTVPGFPFVGGNLLIPVGHRFKISQVHLNVPHLNVVGGGTFFDGKLFIGSTEGEQNVLHVNLDNVIFAYSERAPGNIGIEFGKARNVTIKKCLFINTDKSIYTAPNVDYGFHDISQITITDNKFQHVNYDIFIDLYDDFSTNTKRWMTCSDWKFSNNLSNIAVFTSVWIKAIDGLSLMDNVFFHSSIETLRNLKGKSVYVGESDWLIISGNHIFEPGYEGIHLDNPKHYSILNNEIAWPGQREPRSSILITGSSNERGIIHSNDLSLFTLHGVDLQGIGKGRVSVKSNLMEYEDVNENYFGTTPLNSLTHHTVKQVRSTNVYAVSSNNETASSINLTANIKRRYGESFKTNKRSQFASTSFQQSVSAGQTLYNLCELESVTSNKATYDGMLYVSARQTDSDDTNTASYILHVSKGKAGATVSEISKAGLIYGTSVNHPSFTFTIDGANNLLKVSGIENTQGMFYFEISYIGNIELIK